jgi:hypothetical protein
MTPPLHTNALIYLAIAEEANSEAQALWNAARVPKPDGSDGHVISYDPSARSFKQSLIAIAFAAAYFEALIYMLGTTKVGAAWADKMDRKTYEDKLHALGVADEELIISAKRLRLSRNDLIHEKAIAVGEIAAGDLRRAHVEAAHSINFIHQLQEYLQLST